MNRLSIPSWAFLLVTVSAVPTLADDPVVAGRALVQMYCTDCHATEMTGDSPLPIAPRFRELYLRYDVEDLAEALVEGIVTAHPEMPQFEFDPEQATAIIAYLKTLEPHSVEADQQQGPSQ
ncbi:c-type cytochrome [Devosia sp. SL43]|uniref:c-type cytochrome n=1 Tax=Devosia sp. SL43 TaxID=2806348 RepID=UPI001F3F7060|nr:cytochrome c [Devosia sp. SL43]UJW83904.1 cytochrome c [Devosia sp. SL43]